MADDKKVTGDAAQTPLPQSESAGGSGEPIPKPDSESPPAPEWDQEDPVTIQDWTDESPIDVKVDTRLKPSTSTVPAYVQDGGFYRLVIVFSGWGLILSIGGMLLLAADVKEVPQGVVAAASGLVGLMSGLFTAKSGHS